MPTPAKRREQDHAVREVRSSPGGRLRTVPLRTWVTLGLTLYVLTAVSVAAAITDQEETGFGMNLVVSLIALALLLVIYVIPTLFVGYIVFMFLLEGVINRTGGWAKRRERRRADRAARKAGLPTQRQAKRHRARAARAEKAQRDKARKRS